MIRHYCPDWDSREGTPCDAGTCAACDAREAETAAQFAWMADAVRTNPAASPLRVTDEEIAEWRAVK